MSSRSSYLVLCLLLASMSAQGEEPQAPATLDADPAAAAAPPVERAPVQERSQADATALAQTLEAKEQQQLQTPDESFLALWLPANVGAPSGVVIIVPGDSESADWPKTIGPLRQKLPNAGWHSLSLMLPDPSQPFVPARSAEPVAEPPSVDPSVDPSIDSATPTEDAPVVADQAPPTDTPAPAETAPSAAAPVIAATPSDPESLRKAHSARILARIEAGVAFAKQQQAQRIVLLGHGSGAYWAAHYLAERKPADVQHLLLVAAELPADYSSALDELVPSLKLATGDFYYKDQLADRNAALKRMQASKRIQHPGYSQVALKALPGNPTAEQEQLYRRIRGWLSPQSK